MNEGAKTESNQKQYRRMKNGKKRNEQKKDRKSASGHIRNIGYRESRLETAGRFLTGLIYPPHCPVCDSILPLNGRKICPACENALPWVRQPCCMKCGKMIGDPGKEYCDDCMKVWHIYDRGAAVFQYTGKMSESIGRIKSGSRREYLDYYADAMVECGQKWMMLWKPDVMIPVPMYWKKKNRRGYNQSEILAERIGRRTGIKVMTNAVKKVRDTRPQKELQTAGRKKNLRGAFALSGELVNVRTALIIDDVYTTGSTVDEVAGVLKSGGVLRVYFLTLCIGKGKKAIYIAEKM